MNAKSNDLTGEQPVGIDYALPASISFEPRKGVQENEQEREKTKLSRTRKTRQHLLTLICKDIAKVGGAAVWMRMNSAVKTAIARIGSGLVIRCEVKCVVPKGGSTTVGNGRRHFC